MQNTHLNDLGVLARVALVQCMPVRPLVYPWRVPEIMLSSEYTVSCYGSNPASDHLWVYYNKLSEIGPDLTNVGEDTAK